MQAAGAYFSERAEAAEFLKWTVQLPAGRIREAAFIGLSETEARHQTAGMLEILAAMDPGPARDRVAINLVTWLHENDSPEGAARLLGHVPPGERKDELKRWIAADLFEIDPEKGIEFWRTD